MATPGYYIAEAHVMRKLHKEKMKQIEEERAKRSGDDVVSGVKRSSTGCFGMFKKIHPRNNVAQTMGSAEEEEKEVNNLDYKAL
ncbi:hypothetical protein L484_021517 [Morus notabilis]|uniref:Uncharacterized protein n=1 Tax=Morus notabilis TaxID=981085 RepID=W9RSR1_9ROSA|nr:hypothetical protein L484_021517 [Morus notabilis]